MAGARFWILHAYDRDVKDRGSEAHLAFFRRHRHFWRLSALVWGLVTALHFDRASLADHAMLARLRCGNETAHAVGMTAR